MVAPSQKKCLQTSLASSSFNAGLHFGEKLANLWHKPHDLERERKGEREREREGKRERESNSE